MELEKMRCNAKKGSTLLKAMANEKRLLILCHLLHGELCVGEIEEHIGLSQSALSQHLAVLRRDEIVETRREAQTIYYSLKGEDAKSVLQTLYGIYCTCEE